MPNKHLLSAYEPVESVPDDIKWRPVCGMPSKTHVSLVSTPGGFFRLKRELATGAVQYFRLKDLGPNAAPKEKIDAEPKREGQVRYRVGAKCWFVVDGRWFLVEVVDRTGGAAGTGDEKRITIKPASTHDADKLTPWPYDEFLEFVAQPSNPLFQRLRPLKDRYH